jgi:serine/threonine protein kinase
LIALEINYRRQRGESPSLDEYRQRFPEHVQAVEEAWCTIDRSRHDTSAGQSTIDVEKKRSAHQPLTDEPARTRGERFNAEQPLSEKIGRYHIRKLLGSGGFGCVYLAYDDQLQREVAIKVPLRERISQPEDVETYLAEARIVASLDHPAIVPVHDVGQTEDGLCFVVSKFIQGRDLATQIAAQRLSPEQSARLVATVAEALHYAHSKKLIHRDIKPANILIDSKGKPFVTDFGLALKEQQYGKRGRSAGTPAYMSPEQARGEGHLMDGGRTSSVWASCFTNCSRGNDPSRDRAGRKCWIG